MADVGSKSAMLHKSAGFPVACWEPSSSPPVRGSTLWGRMSEHLRNLDLPGVGDLESWTIQKGLVTVTSVIWFMPVFINEGEEPGTVRVYKGPVYDRECESPDAQLRAHYLEPSRCQLFPGCGLRPGCFCFENQRMYLFKCFGHMQECNVSPINSVSQFENSMIK